MWSLTTPHLRVRLPGVRKPEQRWQTRRHRAIRRTEPPAWSQDPRGEAFVLEFDDGRRGWAELTLAEQRVDPFGSEDPDLVHAVKCWLIARGRRTIDLCDARGRRLAEGAITASELGCSVSERPATRLISLAPSNLECIHALGCFDRVVACEDSSDFPEQVAGLERLGPDLGPDLDRVVALEPDLVVASLTVPGMERVVSGLRARDLPVVVLAPRSLADMLDDLARLARLLDVRDRADALVAELREEIAALEREVAAIAEPARVYLEWWPRPMFSPGRDCYSNELIRLAGGVNVFDDRPGASVEITADELLAAAPEVCFVSWCGVAADKLEPRRLIERPGLESLAAAREGRVYALDERFSGRPGPRMLEAARIMAAGIRRARVLPSPK
jgi:iron complex transport system substrate-binding protein